MSTNPVSRDIPPGVTPADWWAAEEERESREKRRRVSESERNSELLAALRSERDPKLSLGITLRKGSSWWPSERTRLKQNCMTLAGRVLANEMSRKKDSEMRAVRAAVARRRRA